MAGIDTPAGYSRLERIGTGPDADRYRAWDDRAGRWAVLKLYHRFAAGRADEAAFATFIAASVGLGSNASIVPVRAGGITATGRPWLALDLIDGSPLADVPHTPAEALHLVITLADALAWAHTMRPPMVHGRIRLESVLVSATGIPMISDFMEPRPAGTPVPTISGDVTDLGAVLFRLLTGGPWPGRGEDDDRIIAFWPGLTGLLDEVLTPVPAIDSMAVFAARLRQVRGPVVITPAAPAPEEQTPAVYERKRWLSSLAAVLKPKRTSAPGAGQRETSMTNYDL